MSFRENSLSPSLSAFSACRLPSSPLFCRLTDTESSGLYLRELLCPRLKAGQIVVMDNLSMHRSAWVRELIEQEGASVVLLPPYSPDFTPIEEAFSKVKGLLRKAGARTLEGLFKATHRALGAVTAEDARGFFEHCGYRLQGQLL
jgi:transposase